MNLAVETLNSTKKNGEIVSKLITDEDSTTMAKIQDGVPFEVEKQSDANHAKKKLKTAR